MSAEALVENLSESSVQHVDCLPWMHIARESPRPETFYRPLPCRLSTSRSVYAGGGKSLYGNSLCPSPKRFVTVSQGI